MVLLGKRCQYKVLGLGGDCTADEIRSAYHRLALLQHHPDKLAQFGVSPTAFQELATSSGGDCTADEIHSAYRRLALQRHPDKLAQFGVSPAAFQELAAAYKVFSDPREWVDWLLLGKLFGKVKGMGQGPYKMALSERYGSGSENGWRGAKPVKL
ncbi:hypothetical protein RJ639_006505 [Escallonia herrerae]|uniref:J domain-containing protein n=1 Tax=Escallonia herrerae TaxID=1293975 RepID=A0AA88VYT8_9ASTE|nr:hypothetical protein RJ639_006505 [Escallonia herrerae]